MAHVQFVVSSVVGAEYSSSKAKYQFAKYLVDEHQTTILARMPIEDESIADNADVQMPPGGVYLRTLLFPIYAMSFLLLGRTQTDIVATDRSGDAILPVALFRWVLSPWVIMCPDSPDGKRIRREREKHTTSFDVLHERVMDRVARYGYDHADMVILSDETDLIDDSRTTVVRGGVDCEAVESVRAETEISADDDLRVIYVGNMYYHRGIDTLFDALEQCEEDVEVLLVGPGPEAGGESTVREFQEHVGPSLEAVITNLSLDCRYLSMLPHRETVAKMLSADIGICLLPYQRGLPHFRDSYPIKIFEYMYTDLAVIATRTPATEDLLDDPQLVPTEDPAAVASALDRLAADDDLREQCAQRNRTAVEPHCWDALRNDIDVAVNRLLKD